VIVINQAIALPRRESKRALVRQISR